MFDISDTTWFVGVGTLVIYTFNMVLAGILLFNYISTLLSITGAFIVPNTFVVVFNITFNYLLLKLLNYYGNIKYK